MQMKVHDKINKCLWTRPRTGLAREKPAPFKDASQKIIIRRKNARKSLKSVHLITISLLLAII